MKTNQISIVLKFFVSGFVIFISPSLHAWEIKILNPSSVYSYAELPNHSSVSTFSKYLSDTNSLLTTGSLFDYSITDSDAVIVNVANTNYLYTDTEIQVLKDLLNSNTRVLVFGELDGNWQNSNRQLADIVGGIYGGAATDYQSINSGISSMITENVNNIQFHDASKVLPNGENGITLSNDNSMTLWGANENFLLIMDINLLSSRINDADNKQLAMNIANWLAGSDINIPEPSSYGFISGIVILGLTITHRRKR